MSIQPVGLDQDYSKEDVVVSKDRNISRTVVGPSSQQQLGFGGRPIQELNRLNGNFKYRQQTRDLLASMDGTTNQGLDYYLSLFEPNSTHEFAGQPVVPTTKMGENLFNIMLPSMPNFSCCPFENTYREEGKTSSIDVYTCGTHTGKPFGLPNLSPIPTTNRHIRLSPATLTITWSENGKIEKTHCTRSADGSLLGLTGFYVQLGGKLPVTKQYLPTIQNFFKLHNTQQVPKQAILALFNPNAQFQFKGIDAQLPPTAFVDTIQLLHDTLPDFQVQLLEETYSEQLLTAIVDVQAIGTHTGKPFVFPPGGCMTPLEPSGKKISIARERVTIQFDGTGKFLKINVETIDGTVGGPVGAYLSLGGKLETGLRNKYRAVEAYHAFTVGDIPKITSMAVANADWVWGEDHPYSIRSLPWCGRQNSYADAFSEFDRSTRVLKFQPRTITPISANTIIAVVDIIIQSKKTNKIRAQTLVHQFEINEEGKLDRFREFTDTAALLEMYE